MIGRILLTLVILAITGFVLLVLIGLWDRHEQEELSPNLGDGRAQAAAI